MLSLDHTASTVTVNAWLINKFLKLALANSYADNNCL